MLPRAQEAGGCSPDDFAFSESDVRSPGLGRGAVIYGVARFLDSFSRHMPRRQYHSSPGISASVDATIRVIEVEFATGGGRHRQISLGEGMLSPWGFSPA